MPSASSTWSIRARRHLVTRARESPRWYKPKRNVKASKTPPQTIDEYIAGFPPDVQAIHQKIRSTIQNAAPDAVEAMKYGVPTFVLHGNLVHWGGYQKHIGFYPGPSGIEAFKEQLSAYKGAKGSVQFPLDQPLPYALIKKIVAFRVKEARAAAANKQRK
jgi:uncharacterized protein YdhG (YjbR/CyaY superfamily)